MHITDSLEFLYLMLMLRWEQTAPHNGHQGLLLNGEKIRNTQISRMGYILTTVANNSYSILARYTLRNDGESYISKNSSWMGTPYPLGDGWYFEGDTSLLQKQSILQHLTKLGLSGTFVACADDFVAGNSLQKYLPTEKDEKDMLDNIQLHEAKSRLFLQELTNEEQKYIHKIINDVGDSLISAIKL